MVVGRLDKRVHIRVDTETYEAYEKVATFFNRTIADLMREALHGTLPTVHTFGAMIDQAKAGDAEAVQRLFDAMLTMHAGNLDLARELAAAEVASPAEGATEGVRTSNTAL